MKLIIALIRLSAAATALLFTFIAAGEIVPKAPIANPLAPYEILGKPNTLKALCTWYIMDYSDYMGQWSCYYRPDDDHIETASLTITDNIVNHITLMFSDMELATLEMQWGKPDRIIWSRKEWRACWNSGQVAVGWRRPYLFTLHSQVEYLMFHEPSPCR